MKLRNIFRHSLLTGVAAMTVCSLNATNKKIEKKPLNVLLITADDLNCNSVGIYGSDVRDITPNIDRLAGEGVRFTNAFVNVAVCQPSRGIIATGLFSHNSNIEGFFHTEKDIPTIIESLHDNGYYTGILGKVEHSSPKYDTPWDLKYDMPDLGMGRDKDIYYQKVKEFLRNSKKEGKPFYLMANSHDPHRPFAKSESEKKRWKNKNIKDPAIIYKPDEIEVPGFLPQIPDVKLEVAEYYSSVKRMDETVGKVLQAVEEEGLSENTLVVFLSDHGMAFPFSKTNCYLHSNKTPWIVKWPGHVTSNLIDSKHFISTIDFYPTILDILNIKAPENLDGKSFKKILEGKNDNSRNMVFTQFYETSAANVFPMRAVQNESFAYIFNAWSNGERCFRNESQHGRSWKAMVEAAKTDKWIAERVELFSHRVVEEFYDLEKDPNALHNLINDPAYQGEIASMRKELHSWMKKNNDPVVSAFENRNNPELREKYVSELQKKAKERKKRNKEKGKK